MANPIDFYFDFSSPYGYFAGEKIDALAAKHGRAVTWRPILLGAVFKITGGQPLPTIPMKGSYAAHDLARSARYFKIPFKLPSKDRRTEAHRGHGDLAPRFHRRQASPRSLRSNPAGAETGSPAARTAAGWSPPTGVVPIAQHDQQRPTRDQIEGCPPSSWGTSPCCISPGRTKLSTNSTTDHADRTTERPRCRRPARRSRPPDPNAWDEDKPRSD